MKWNKKEISGDEVRSVMARYSLGMLEASIFARRGIAGPEQILYYLEEDSRYLHEPFSFRHMEDAVDRLLTARDEGEKVLVFGDADTDGISSTVLVYETLAAMDLDCTWRVPTGEDAYGLSIRAIDEFHALNGTLIITVDCGISNHQEVLHARELGIDVIILDHHRLQSHEPPEAVAVINPKIEDCGYPFKGLAGCGVAYTFVSALRIASSEIYKQHIALLDLYQEGDGYVLEAVRLVNLVETGRLTERLTPGELKLEGTKFVRFLSDWQILTWDAQTVRRNAKAVLGKSAELYVQDIAPMISEVYPVTAGRDLGTLRAQSKAARYSTPPATRIDILKNLFISWQRSRLPELGASEEHRMQLVALGTIADLMPLRDENRIFVKRGLQAIHKSPRPGISHLLTALQLRDRDLKAQEIAWQVTPSINATGRLGAADRAIALLLETDSQKASALAATIVSMNQERKKLGSDGWDSVLPLARESVAGEDSRIAIVRTDKVHRGITGLIASRVVSTFKIPAIIASVQSDGIISGSMRSIRGFKLPALLAACSDCFLDFGGHDAAAGFSMVESKWEDFVTRTRAYMQGIDLGEQEESVEIDAELPHEYMKPDILALVRKFEPSGEESPPLLFMAKRVPMIDAQIVGKLEKNHLKLTLDFGVNKWPALLWDGAKLLEREFSFRNQDLVDLVFRISVNRWNGSETPQIEIVDIRRSC